VEEKIQQIVNQKLEETGFEDYFLLEIIIKSKKVEIIIDSDNGVIVDKCQKISRAVETFLDESKPLGEDYTLEVTSPGITRPLILLRQYRKNIGRILTIDFIDNSESQEGELKEVSEDNITIAYQTKRKEGKKNIKEDIEKIIPISNIKKAIIKLSF
jgi:ribosome maturation factor RimP